MQCIQSGKPIIVLTDDFAGHAMLMLSIDTESNTYRALDTVSGMILERSLNGEDTGNLQFLGIELYDQQEFIRYLESLIPTVVSNNRSYT